MKKLLKWVITTTGNLLDFAYFKENYKLIPIDLSKQTKLKDPQQINFLGKLLKNTWADVFHYRKIKRNYFYFFTKFCHNHINNGNSKNCKFIKWFW